MYSIKLHDRVIERNTLTGFSTHIRKQCKQNHFSANKFINGSFFDQIHIISKQNRLYESIVQPISLMHFYTLLLQSNLLEQHTESLKSTQCAINFANVFYAALLQSNSQIRKAK